MNESGAVGLPIVDGMELDREHRELLRPDELMRDREGRARRLPRFFFRVESWALAQEVELSPHFSLWEFMDTDVREAELLRQYPRYVPCAVTLLAAQLELLRVAMDTFVHISANGGYRSPSHAHSTFATPHCWGTAANLYKIGDDLFDNESAIRKHNRIVTRLLPVVWVRPYGNEVGEADDHVHLDLGYVTLVPRDAPSEEDRALAPAGTLERSESA